MCHCDEQSEETNSPLTGDYRVALRLLASPSAQGLLVMTLEIIYNFTRQCLNKKGQILSRGSALFKSLNFTTSSYEVLSPVGQFFFEGFEQFIEFVRLVPSIPFKKDGVEPFGDLVLIFDSQILLKQREDQILESVKMLAEG